MLSLVICYSPQKVKKWSFKKDAQIPCFARSPYAPKYN